MDFEIAKIGERGQIVIPQDFRETMHISKGDKFMVIARGDMLLLKRLEAPSKEEFDKMLKKGHAHAKQTGLKESDVADAVRRARKKK